jgi:dethiobiotin synthetase
MRAGLFVTGTDTGVGKTIVSGGICAFLRHAGLRVGVLKPTETGCLQEDGTMHAQDAEFLKTMAGTDDPVELIVPYQFREPLAPAVAAEREGAVVDVHHLLKVYTDIAQRHDFILVEGAGGLMVPLSDDYMVLDLVKDLQLPLLVVSRATLGTINHTLLTVRCAQASGIKVVGIVMNHTSPEQDVSAPTNPEIIRRLSRIPLWGVLPYEPALTPAFSFEGRVTDLVQTHLDLGYFNFLVK